MGKATPEPKQMLAKDAFSRLAWDGATIGFSLRKATFSSSQSNFHQNIVHVVDNSRKIFPGFVQTTIPCRSKNLRKRVEDPWNWRRGVFAKWRIWSNMTLTSTWTSWALSLAQIFHEYGWMRKPTCRTALHVLIVAAHLQRLPWENSTGKNIPRTLGKSKTVYLI